MHHRVQETIHPPKYDSLIGMYLWICIFLFYLVMTYMCESSVEVTFASFRGWFICGLFNRFWYSIFHIHENIVNSKYMTSDMISDFLWLHVMCLYYGNLPAAVTC